MQLLEQVHYGEMGIYTVRGCHWLLKPKKHDILVEIISVH